jgi:hypothetical protein
MVTCKQWTPKLISFEAYYDSKIYISLAAGPML